MTIKVENMNQMEPEALLQALGLVQPPFDPFAIARQIEGLNILQEADFDRLDKSGSVCLKAGKAEVWINPIDIPERQNFTLAHEIGHISKHLLPAQSGQFTDDSATLYRSGDSDPKEREANDFAARLLMPKDHITTQGKAIILAYKAAKNTTNMPAEDFVAEMAKKFNVSKQAMMFRLQNLNVIKKAA